MRLPTKLHYAWVVAAVTFVVLLLTAGVRAAPGILIVPFENEFHWARFDNLLCGRDQPVALRAYRPLRCSADRPLGVRRTMAVALAVTAAAVALTPAMRQSWQLILLWASSRCELRGHRQLPRRVYCRALVPGAPGARRGRIDGSQRRWSADLPPDHGKASRPAPAGA